MTTRTAASPANCGASAALPRTPRRSANSCGRISCASRYRARASKRILRRRSRRRWRSPKARMRFICRAGAAPRLTTRVLSVLIESEPDSNFLLTRFLSREPGSTPDQVRGRLSLENALAESTRLFRQPPQHVEFVVRPHAGYVGHPVRQRKKGG